MIGFTSYGAGLSLRAGGQGFSPATKRVAPGYFYWKIEPKEIPSRLIPRLLVVFTRQLEILVTTLYGEMIFHTNFLASGGNSVQNIMSKTMPIQKNALKIN